MRRDIEGRSNVCKAQIAKLWHLVSLIIEDEFDPHDPRLRQALVRHNELTRRPNVCRCVSSTFLPAVHSDTLSEGGGKSVFLTSDPKCCSKGRGHCPMPNC